MKRSTKYKFTSLLSLGAVLFGYNQCVTPMGGSNQKSTMKWSDSTASKSVSGTNGATRAVSLDAFSKTVYPVTKARCVSCHGTSQTPLHASNDVNTAYDAVINASKVDFNNPANSRLVLKLKNEFHNCWGNCESNANEILAQINAWKTLTAGTAADVVNTNVSGKTTRETTTVSMALNPDNNSNAGTVTLMAESASIKSPMVSASENGTGYVWTSLTAGIKNLTNQDAGNAILNFSVTASDFYKVFMFVSAPTVDSDSVYVKVAGSDYKEWTIDPTTGFEWKEMTNTPQKLQTEFYLTGSKSYQLEIRQKEPGVKISKVVITSDMTYDPNAMARVNQKATMTVSLADLIGVADAFIDIDIEEYDLYSYKLTNPRIRTSKDLKIQKLKILVNGSYNPQHSTYMTVDKIVTKADPLLSPYSMVLLKDKGSELDKLSFSFDVIEVVK